MDILPWLIPRILMVKSLFSRQETGRFFSGKSDQPKRTALKTRVSPVTSQENLPIARPQDTIITITWVYHSAFQGFSIKYEQNLKDHQIFEKDLQTGTKQANSTPKKETVMQEGENQSQTNKKHAHNILRVIREDVTTLKKEQDTTEKEHVEKKMKQKKTK